MYLSLLEISLILYSLLFVYLIIGLIRTRHASRNDYVPVVSIIVAARNEEEHIAECVQSLANLHYPPDKLDIIIADDRSSDSTPSILKEYSQKYPFIRSFTTTPGNDQLRGKANAVAQALHLAKGEIILQTDADCSVEPDWVREIVKSYDEKTGVVSGYTLLHSNNWFSAMQALDWLMLFSVAAAGISWKKPITVVGNHLTYRRKAYDDVGGYQNIKFSVTEDYALIRAIYDQRKWQFRFRISSKAIVHSYPCDTLEELYLQRLRWGMGGLDMKLRDFFVMGIGTFLHAILILGLLFSPRMDYWFAAFVIKTILDVIVLTVPLKATRSFKLLKYILHFELFYIIYVVALPIALLLNRKIEWKDRKY